MGNSFTVFPNVLPGNVTIGGNLTVGGDVVRIGAGVPYVRVGKDTSSRGCISWNSDLSFGWKDTPGIAASVLDFSVDPVNPSYVRINPANTSQAHALMDAIFTDYTTHNHTGTLTEDTIYSKLIPGGTIGANGGLDIEFALNRTAQGAAATQLRIKLGGLQLAGIPYTATGVGNVRFRMVNQNAQNAQITTGFVIDNGAGGSVVLSPTTQNVDTSVDQTLIITIQNGTNTDSQSFVPLHVKMLNSFGPV